MFESEIKESIQKLPEKSEELPEKENLVGFFTLLLEVDKRINGKINI